MTSSDRAAEFVLGLLASDEREVVVREAATDPALAREVDAWQERLAPLDGEAEVAPPPDMFARIQATIAARAQPAPAALTVRAGEGRWRTIAPGIERKMLWADGPHGRVTYLVRGAPGAVLPEHEHDDDEECYVISGDLSFGPLTLNAGDYHLARRGMRHPPATTRAGCLLLITEAA
jgi:anti-sigma factor ChrR (cupin superfamily)